MSKTLETPPVQALLLSLDDAAQIVGVSRDTIRRAVYAGELAVVRPGRGAKKSKIFVRRATLLAWIEQLEMKGV
ncbi:MAG: helix-turn-helix domain-containing protein [Planctomycetes bacterium]|nr:helix-turn-helix domain-containing protein [Planctomycetota bacterium]MCL4731489.1 helix-turn-helix domain-containing protein [Planctomycetota bacterium]